jgi:large subunit ribosomal protein L6
MSRIGKKPIPVPAGVKVDLSGRQVKVSGPKGNLTWTVPTPIEVGQDQGRVVVRRPNNAPRNRALHGLSRALIANMVRGVAEGYEVKLEIYGTGYGCQVQGGKLQLNLGYSGRGHNRPTQFALDIPEELEIDVQVPVARGNTEPARFAVRGADKQQVGQFAAEVRKLRKPEPYLGKGIRYAGEHIRRKAGKVFAGGGAG